MDHLKQLKKDLGSFLRSAPIILGVLGIVYYALLVSETNQFNPVKARAYLRAKYNVERQEDLRLRESYLKKIEEYDQLYRSLYDKLIRKADKNRDGIVSFVEQADAWKMMGYISPFFESKGFEQFPCPTLNNLEDVVGTKEFDTPIIINIP